MAAASPQPVPGVTSAAPTPTLTYTPQQFDATKHAATLSAREQHVYTAGKLLAETFPPVEEILQGMLIEGRSCVIGGGYGVGKTTLCLELGVGLAVGEPVFGRSVARAYRVGYFDLELGAAEFQTRLKLATSKVIDSTACDDNFVYVDGSTESDLFGKLKLQRDGTDWLLADLICEHRLEVVFIDNLSLAISGKLEEADICMGLHKNLGLLRKRAPTLKLVILPAHLVKPARGKGPPPPSLLQDPRGWLAGIRGSGKLLDHITQRFGFDQEKDKSGREYFVLNGISSHRVISPLVLEQDMETRQFRVSTDQSFNLSVIFTRAELDVWCALPKRFKYAEAKKHGGTGYRTFKKGQEHGLLAEVESGWWEKMAE